MKRQTLRVEMNGRVIFLSQPAYDAATAGGFFPSGSGQAATVQDAILQIQNGDAWIALVADLSQINDSLALEVYEAQRASNVPVGVIPYSRDAEHKFRLLLSPTTGRDPSLVQTRAVTVHGPVEQAKVLSLADGAEAGFRWLEKDSDFASELKNQDIDAFAAILNGRQTFLFLGNGHALHPGMNSELANVHSAHDVRVKHWFLQSCHSPFVWPDFGEYMSLPLALLLRGSASSVVTSSHVQTFIPHVLRAYLELSSHGVSVGEIVLALNRLASDNKCDYGPFLLLGHPASTVTTRATVTPSHDQYIDARKQEIGIKAVATRRSASNLLFATYPPHFAFNPASHRTKRWRQQTDQLSATYGRRIRTLRFVTAKTEAAPEARLPESFELVQGINVETVQDSFADVCAEHRGYYYHLSDFVEQWYEPDECVPISARCLSCATPLRQRRHKYLGPFPAEDYSKRTQRICPRCLIVSDLCDLPDTDVALAVVLEEEKNYRLTVTIENRSMAQRHARILWRLNDPNNASQNISPKVVSELLNPVRFETGTNVGVIAPRSSVTFFAKLDVDQTTLFYLLVEIDVFVDGAWNWLSFTIRRPHIASWLASDVYLKTLPNNDC